MILPNFFTSILKLPQFSLDYKEFATIEYVLIDNDMRSPIFKENSKFRETKELVKTDVKNLLIIKDSVERDKTKAFDSIEHFFYELEGFIIDILPHNAKNLYKKFCPLCMAM